jgi:hypothetical protein
MGYVLAARKELRRMTDKPTVGQFVSELLHAGKRRVAQSGNPAGYSALYPEVARAVLAEYVQLSQAEKQAVYGTLKSDAERFTIITNQDHISGLHEASDILGVAKW